MEENKQEIFDKINEALKGSFTSEGIIAWWQQEKTLLDGHTPFKTFLEEGGPEKILKYVEALNAGIAT